MLADVILCKKKLQVDILLSRHKLMLFFSIVKNLKYIENYNMLIFYVT